MEACMSDNGRTAFGVERFVGHGNREYDLAIEVKDPLHLEFEMLTTWIGFVDHCDGSSIRGRLG